MADNDLPMRLSTAITESRSAARNLDRIATEARQAGLLPWPYTTREKITLSEREATVLRLLAADMSNERIGEHLNLSAHTVKDHTSSVFRKLGVTGRAGAVAEGFRAGLIS